MDRYDEIAVISDGSFDAFFITSRTEHSVSVYIYIYVGNGDFIVRNKYINL